MITNVLKTEIRPPYSGGQSWEHAGPCTCHQEASAQVNLYRPQQRAKQGEALQGSEQVSSAMEETTMLFLLVPEIQFYFVQDLHKELFKYVHERKVYILKS